MLWRGNSCGKEKRWKGFLELLSGVSKIYEELVSRLADTFFCIWSRTFCFLDSFFVHANALIHSDGVGGGATVP